MTIIGDIKYSDLSNFKLIGKGIFGIVYKALYLGTEVAVKECLPLLDQPGYNLEKYFDREVTILKECRHPNIVQYMGTCIHDNKFYIVTEYIRNDNLKTWITERLDELSWKLRISFAIDIARAMAYLHSKNIIHRDIKPENLLITENGRVKICDFGFSRFDARTEEERRHLSYCGTEAYMAPEIILCMDFDMTVDIFGYGVILCEMIAGNIAESTFKRKIPGFEIDSNDIYTYAKKDPQCPENFVELAIQCIEYEKRKRPSWIEIIDILNKIDENITDNYNIGIIPASELLSNDFFIPLSPLLRGQSSEEFKKASSIKSLNIDVDEERINQKEKYNGRPTSPILNTKRLSNQYYYYYAVNNPTCDKHESNVYRRLPAYIVPPLEHSSFIAIPKEITKSNSINIYKSKNENRNSNNTSNNTSYDNRNNYRSNNTKNIQSDNSNNSFTDINSNSNNRNSYNYNNRNSYSYSNSNNNSKDNGNKDHNNYRYSYDNSNNSNICSKRNSSSSTYVYRQYKLSSSSEPKNSIYLYDSDLEDQKDTHLMSNDQIQVTTSFASTSSSSHSSSSSSILSVASNYSINNLSSNDVNTLINTYNNSNTSLSRIYKINNSNCSCGCSCGGGSGIGSGSGSGNSDSSNSNSNSINFNNSRKEALNKIKNENKRIIFGEMLFGSSSEMSDSKSKSKSLKTTLSSNENLTSKRNFVSNQKPILICSKNSLKKNKNENDSTDENKENIKYSKENGNSISKTENDIISSSMRNSNGDIEKSKKEKKTKTVIKKSSINYKNKKSNKKVTIKDTNIINIQAIENISEKSYSGIHHRFSINYFPSISKCNVCHRRMNLVKRHLSCDDCDFHCHAKCSSLAPFTCKPKK